MVSPDSLVACSGAEISPGRSLPWDEPRSHHAIVATSCSRTEHRPFAEHRLCANGKLPMYRQHRLSQLMGRPVSPAPAHASGARANLRPRPSPCRVHAPSPSHRQRGSSLHSSRPCQCPARLRSVQPVPNAPPGPPASRAPGTQLTLHTRWRCPAKTCQTRSRYCSRLREQFQMDDFSTLDRISLGVWRRRSHSAATHHSNVDALHGSSRVRATLR